MQNSVIGWDMRRENIIASIAIAFWIGLLWLGAASTKAVIAQNVKNFPTAGQIDLTIGIPLKILIVIFGAMAVANVFHQFRLLLILVAIAALVGILPYLTIYGGGV